MSSCLLRENPSRADTRGRSLKSERNHCFEDTKLAASTFLSQSSNWTIDFEVYWRPEVCPICFRSQIEPESIHATWENAKLFKRMSFETGEMFA